MPVEEMIKNMIKNWRRTGLKYEELEKYDLHYLSGMFIEHLQQIENKLKESDQ